MQRECEAELMEEEEQARAYAAADFSSTDQPLVARILELLAMQGPAARRLLDLGCGPGNISFPLAEALPGVPLLALDGAAAMLEPGRDRQRLQPRRWPLLHFHQAVLPLDEQALAGVPASHQPPFDAMVSNSLLHHLHDPQVLWRSLRQLGAPGSLVVVCDLRRPSDPAELDALVERHSNDAPAVLQRDYRASLRAAFRPEEVEEQLVAAGLGGLRVQALDDSHLQVTGLLE